MVNIQGHNFEGPYQLGTRFDNVPGVYAVYTSQVWLDIGETESLGDRINDDNHERKPDWIRNSNNLPVFIAFLAVADSQTRLNIESLLRSVLNPVCGER